MPQYELNLMDYWQIINKRRLVILVIFFAIFLTTVLYTQSLTPQYKATATITVTEHRTYGMMLENLVGVYTGDPVVSYARVITSQPIIEGAVRQLGLAGKDAKPEEITRLASSLQGTVSTNIQQGTNIISINVTHSDRELTAKLANKIVEVFIAENLKEKSKQVRKVREFIEIKLAEIEKKLIDTEETLRNFKEKEAPSGIALGLQDKLVALQIEKNKLSKTYTDIHPDVEKLNQQIEELKTQLKQLPRAELNYARLTREVQINDNTYRELKRRLENARIAESEKVENVSLVDPAFPPLSPFSPNKSLNYFLGAVVGLMLGLTGAFLVEQLDTSITTIEEVEGFLKLPALGIIPYLKAKDEKKTLIQRLWPKKLTGKDKILHLRNQLLIHYTSSSPAFEAYRMLRTNIQKEVFKENTIQGKIILLSSSGPEEGKSITISNLAIVMAQSGLHTLLVDADMRRSAIHKIFGLEKKEPGLCDILRGQNKPEEVIHKFTDILLGKLGVDEVLKVPGLDNLNILTSGSSMTTPAESLASGEMNALLEQLKQNFDLILIDTPPVLAVTDATILSSKSDAVILVYRLGRTAKSLLLRAKTQLIESGAQVKGAILNNISPTVEMRASYYYQYKYYGKYYTSSPKEEEKAIKE